MVFFLDLCNWVLKLCMHELELCITPKEHFPFRMRSLNICWLQICFFASRLLSIPSQGKRKKRRLRLIAELFIRWELIFFIICRRPSLHKFIGYRKAEWFRQSSDAICISQLGTVYIISRKTGYVFMIATKSYELIGKTLNVLLFNLHHMSFKMYGVCFSTLPNTTYSRYVTMNLYISLIFFRDFHVH